jgi:outer membrane protein OmpA-like peptidoglycan-associated protein
VGLAVALGLALLAAAPAPAEAQLSRAFQLHLFEPSVGPFDYFTVQSPYTPGHLGFNVGFLFDYQRRPFVISGATASGQVGAEQLRLVDYQIFGNFYGAIGLTSRLQLGLSLPVAFAASGKVVTRDTANPDGTLPTQSLPNSASFGDMSLHLKALIWQNRPQTDSGLKLAFSGAAIITFPTGDRSSFNGDATVTGRPVLIFGLGYDRLDVSANLGFIFRQSSTLLNAEVGHQMAYGLGAQVMLWPRYLGLVGELSGRFGYSTDRSANPLEVDFGLRGYLPEDIAITVGAGTGLIAAVGSPDVRVFFGIRWAPDFRDTDKDRIRDTRDFCKTIPEDHDGFQDEDGCPDPDNDEDGIPDNEDMCPNEAEDKDDFEDADGCPDDDNDRDGVPDRLDSCPNVPGPADNNGCPTVEKDSDEDGVPDSRDRCPDVPGPKENQGCPDKDTDGDGVVDRLDRCPTLKGPPENFGCPVRKLPEKVKIEGGQIRILEKVFFDTNQATIQERSHGILRQVALVLITHPKLARIRIEGHTDSQGDAERNRQLSRARAQAVKDYLVSLKIDPKRLEIVGHGPDRPIASNRTGQGREQNRRVEFHIAEELKAPPPGAAPAAPAPAPRKTP